MDNYATIILVFHPLFFFRLESMKMPQAARSATAAVTTTGGAKTTLRPKLEDTIFTPGEIARMKEIGGIFALQAIKYAATLGHRGFSPTTLLEKMREAREVFSQELNAPPAVAILEGAFSNLPPFPTAGVVKGNRAIFDTLVLACEMLVVKQLALNNPQN